MQEAQPSPLRPEEVQRVLGRLAPLTQDTQIVLVGGQALAFWSARFAEHDGEIRAVSTKDIDFQGSADSARRAAELLDAKVMIPSPREPSPVTGVVTFVDAEGFDRSLDFIEAPRGLTAEDVQDTAIRVELPSLSGEGAVGLWVMHPERCMESRIYNTIELDRTDEIGMAQLRVSVPITRHWSKALLEDPALDEQIRERSVLNLNERIFEKCCEDQCFLAVHQRYEVDPFEAVLDDARLPEGFRTKRYPQMRERLETTRASVSA
jgi:hypothetical protein